MGNNAEIRQRMDTYRGILIILNWIGSIAGIIAGFALTGVIGGIAFIIVVIAIIIGIIGHFFINVALAIPFILLNNGDILESLEGKMGNTIAANLANTSGRTIVGNKFQKKCKRCNKEVDEDCTGCPHCGNNTFV